MPLAASVSFAVWGRFAPWGCESISVCVCAGARLTTRPVMRPLARRLSFAVMSLVLLCRSVRVEAHRPASRCVTCVVRWPGSDIPALSSSLRGSYKRKRTPWGSHFARIAGGLGGVFCAGHNRQWWSICYRGVSPTPFKGSRRGYPPRY